MAVNNELYGISANHIAPGGVNKPTFEPQRVSNFVLEVGVPGTQVDGTIDAGAERIIALSVREFPMPEERTDAIELQYGNEVRYVAGRTTFGEETLTCVDYIDVDTAGYIYDWRRLVYNPGPNAFGNSGGGKQLEPGAIGYAFMYKSTGSIWWLDPMGSQPPGRRFLMHGMWPMTVRYGRGNMTASEPNIIEVTFKVDRIERVTGTVDDEASLGSGTYV